jgi:uncharacterized protein
MKKIVITGITGLIGKALAKKLMSSGHHVTGFTRDPGKCRSLIDSGVRLNQWDDPNSDAWMEEISTADVIVNLAGENIASGRWTKSRKQQILHSRLNALTRIGSVLNKPQPKPVMLIQASAIGYYGSQPGLVMDETSPAGDGFLAQVCHDTELAAQEIKGAAVVCVRFGIVLDLQGGALAKLTAPMQFGIAGYPGNGKNMVSWIHLEDVVNGINHLIEQQNPAQVYNFTAPEPVIMKQMVKLAGKYKKVLLTIPLPQQLLGLTLGREMVQETLLAHQIVKPAGLLSGGYKFRYPDLKSAMHQLFT